MMMSSRCGAPPCSASRPFTFHFSSSGPPTRAYEPTMRAMTRSFLSSGCDDVITCEDTREAGARRVSRSADANMIAHVADTLRHDDDLSMGTLPCTAAAESPLECARYHHAALADESCRLCALRHATPYLGFDLHAPEAALCRRRWPLLYESARIATTRTARRARDRHASAYCEYAPPRSVAGLKRVTRALPAKRAA